VAFLQLFLEASTCFDSSISSSFATCAALAALYAAIVSPAVHPANCRANLHSSISESILAMSSPPDKLTMADWPAQLAREILALSNSLARVEPSSAGAAVLVERLQPCLV